MASQSSMLMGVREFAAEHPGMGLGAARREMRKLGGFKRGRRLYLARALFDEANWIFREQMRVSRKSGTTQIKPRAVLALLIKAWNFDVAGELPTVLRWSPKGKTGEAFPVIEGIHKEATSKAA